MKPMTTTEVSTRSRFVRSVDLPMQLTKRDLEILRQVQKHRFLDTDLILALVGGSVQNVRRRLRALFQNGYLDRPRAQLLNFGKEGNKPLVYGLGNKGATILSQFAGIERDKIDWALKNQRAGEIFVHHTLEIADFMVGLEVELRDHGADLIEDGDILRTAPEATARARSPFSFRSKVRHAGRYYDLSLIPDKVFGLDHGEQGKAWYFLEADRGTMPVKRAGMSRTSFLRKMLTYYEGWKVGRHTRQFGWKNFRVATVTNSPKRVETMVDAVKEMTDGRGSGLFVFTDRDTLKAASPLTCEWVNGKGQTVTLG